MNGLDMLFLAFNLGMLAGWLLTRRRQRFYDDFRHRYSISPSPPNNRPTPPPPPKP
jgi:hypothetical protein